MLGAGLLLGGVLFLADRAGIVRIDFRVYWPCVLIVLGIFMHMVFVLTGMRDTGFLMPGALMVVFGIFLQIFMLRGFGMLLTIWPLLFIAPLAGVLETYFLGGRDRDLLLIIGLLAIPLLMFGARCLRMPWKYIAPLGVALGGIVVIVYSIIKQSNNY